VVTLNGTCNATSLLHFHISAFQRTCAVPGMPLFCSSVTSFFRGTLFRYFLNDFEMIPVAHIIMGTIFILLYIYVPFLL